jgi:hypothetical protein
MATITKLQVLYVFTTDYYTGQWSRGYRLSCVTRRAIERNGGTFRFMDSKGLMNVIRASALYLYLVRKYGEKM